MATNDQTDVLAKKRILIVDDERTIVDLILSWLPNEESEGFTDPKLAWECAQEKSFDGIILDWKISPELSGLALLNRFRQHPNYKTVPILVISGFLHNKDFNMLEEFPHSSTTEKPIQRDEFLETLKDVFKEQIWYQQKEKMILDLCSRIKSEDEYKVVNEIKALTDSSANPHKLLIMLGKVLRSVKRYHLAETVLTTALKKNKNSILLNNELGKLCLEIGRNKEAKEYLLTAMKMAPENTERLCFLGNISLQELELDQATNYFNKALKVDAGDKKAQNYIRITEGMKEFNETHSQDVHRSYAGMLNAIGIALVKEKKFDEGLKHYTDAMDIVFDKNVKSRLAFNLGLCNARWKKYPEAVKWFKNSMELDPTFTKAANNLKKFESLGTKRPSNPASSLKSGAQSDFDLDSDIGSDMGAELSPATASEKTKPKADTLQGKITTPPSNFDVSDDGAWDLEEPSTISATEPSQTSVFDDEFEFEDESFLDPKAVQQNNTTETRSKSENQLFDELAENGSQIELESEEEEDEDPFDVFDETSKYLFTSEENNPVFAQVENTTENTMVIRTLNDIGAESKLILKKNKEKHELHIVERSVKKDKDRSLHSLTLKLAGSGIDLNQFSPD